MESQSTKQSESQLRDMIHNWKTAHVASETNAYSAFSKIINSDLETGILLLATTSEYFIRKTLAKYVFQDEENGISCIDDLGFSFSKLIKLSSSLNLYDECCIQILHSIRAIRNDIAHTMWLPKSKLAERFEKEVMHKAANALGIKKSALLKEDLVENASILITSKVLLSYLRMFYENTLYQEKPKLEFFYDPSLLGFNEVDINKKHLNLNLQIDSVQHAIITLRNDATKIKLDCDLIASVRNTGELKSKDWGRLCTLQTEDGSFFINLSRMASNQYDLLLRIYQKSNSRKKPTMLTSIPINPSKLLKLEIETLKKDIKFRLDDFIIYHPFKSRIREIKFGGKSREKLYISRLFVSQKKPSLVTIVDLVCSSAQIRYMKKNSTLKGLQIINSCVDMFSFPAPSKIDWRGVFANTF